MVAMLNCYVELRYMNCYVEFPYELREIKTHSDELAFILQCFKQRQDTDFTHFKLATFPRNFCGIPDSRTSSGTNDSTWITGVHVRQGGSNHPVLRLRAHWRIERQLLD